MNIDIFNGETRRILSSKTNKEETIYLSYIKEMNNDDIVELGEFLKSIVSRLNECLSKE